MFFLDSKVDEERFLQLYAAFLSLNRGYKTVESKIPRKTILEKLATVCKLSPKEILRRMSIRHAVKELNDPAVQDTSSNKGERHPFLNKRIAVYTSTFGRSFTLREPLFIPDNCDFFYIGDQDIPLESAWKKFDISSFEEQISKYSGIEKNRFFKMNPHLVFTDYDYSVYIDGNIQLVGDSSEFVNQLSPLGIGLHKHRARNCVYDEAKAVLDLKKINHDEFDKIMDYFKSINFPKNYGLAECNVIVRDHHNDVAIKITEEWWKLFMEKNVKRDQLTFPVAVWENGIDLADILTLGNNVYDNDLLRVCSNV